jgi:selenophosphate synthase
MRIGFADVSSLPDPLLQYQFELIIPTIPGQGSGQGLAIRCKTSSLPGKQQEDVEVTLHGVTTKYSGRTTFTHDLPATFVETRDMYVRDTLNKWLDFKRDIVNTTGNYKSLYATTALMLVYDDTNKVIRTIKMLNFFIKAFDDTGMDGSASTAVEPNATFSYDLWKDE